jgi:hypothetical protein
VLRLCPPSAGSGSPEPLQGAMPGLRGARHSSFAPTFLFAGDPSVTCLLTAMTLTVTGLGTLVALSFVIYSPTLPREGGRRPLACLTRSPRPAGEADAGQTRPPARRAVGGGCTRRGADATIQRYRFNRLLQPPYLSEQFPTELRGRGQPFGESTGRLFAGVLAPYLMEPHTGSGQTAYGFAHRPPRAQE